MRYINLKDMEFVYWKAIEYAGSRKYKSGSVAMWKCKCKCGTIAVVSGQSLRNGRSGSCGCLNREIHRNLLAQKNRDNVKHGGFGTRLYRIWCGMKNRCYNPNEPNYKRYGAKGITVCDEWKDNFEAFRKWALNNGYQDDLSIDRKDGKSGYSPDNCRWATSKEQNNNLSTNIFITFKEKNLTAKQWSEEMGIPYKTVLERYHNNLPPEKIFAKKDNS